MKVLYICVAAAAYLVPGGFLTTVPGQMYKSDPADCCQILQEAGLKHAYLPNGTVYSERVHSYWSLTAQLRPSCFVQPENTEEVSKAVKALASRAQCKFAVRSGGHSSTAGANNVEDGVTLDLSLLNSTTYDPATGLASILPGAHWLNVYRTLDPLGVGVPGGRIGIVGAGGYLSGGGFSLYINRIGLACDSVQRFEVVLASGEIVEASAETNSDLFQALKGGGNNFGVITRFDMQAFKRDPIDSYGLEHPESEGVAHIRALKRWTDGLENYQDGSAVVFWSYRPVLSRTIIITGLSDVSGRIGAPAFDDFLSIPGSISSSSRMTNMSESALGTQASGYRNIWFTVTFKNDIRVITKAVELHHNLVEEMKVESSDGDFETQCFFQPFPAIIARHGAERGGNILGIDRNNDNAIVLLASLAVNGVDQEIMGREKMLVWKDAVEQYSDNLGMLFEYRYMNYADGSQDVLQSYGEENVQKMLAVSRKYDPNGVFQTQVPGGFKPPLIS
ncbi:FAD-binding domain-containing protein [Hypoxylon sp. FL1857]|nr:FAD-binding domain-containing protein [Hypoxylon sp. FL1857]